MLFNYDFNYGFFIGDSWHLIGLFHDQKHFGTQLFFI